MVGLGDEQMSKLVFGREAANTTNITKDMKTKQVSLPMKEF